jgi:hypothetical protein
MWLAPRQLAKLLTALGVSAVSLVHAQSSCTATNEAGTQSCSISCPIGQSAMCVNGAGANDPSCSCGGGSNVQKALVNKTPDAIDFKPISYSSIHSSAFKCLLVVEGAQLVIKNTCKYNLSVEVFWSPYNGSPQTITYRLGGANFPPGSQRPILIRGLYSFVSEEEIKPGQSTGSTLPDAHNSVRTSPQPDGYWWVYNISPHYVWAVPGMVLDRLPATHVDPSGAVLWKPGYHSPAQRVLNGWHEKIDVAEFEPD